MTTTTLIIIITVVVISLLAIFIAMLERQVKRSEVQRERTREEFGSMYEHAATQESGSEEQAQREEQREPETRGIFISYRRDESAGYAGRIADSFGEHFGEDKVFRDIDSIEPGLDFAEAIERAVGSSEVLIAVIGRNWLTATDAAGRKRLENPDDYVRMEIAAALERNIRVVPLLVQGASMPSADELPDDLAPLARRNAFELHDTSWRDDVRRLTSALQRVIER